MTVNAALAAASGIPSTAAAGALADETILLTRLATGAGDAQIAQTLLAAALRLTGAAAGAIRCRAGDGFAGPWTTEGVTRTAAERLNRLLDGYSSTAVVQILDPGHPVLLSLTGRTRPRGLLRAVSMNCDEAQLTVLLHGPQHGTGFRPADAAVLEVLVSVASVVTSTVTQRENRRRYEQWMNAIETTASIMLGGASARSVLETVLESVAQRALTMSGADLCALATLDDSGRSMVLRVALGRHRQTLSGLSFSEQRSLSGTVARSAERLLVDDAATDHRATSVAAEVALGPTVIAPLLLRGRPVAVMFVGNTRLERPLDRELAVQAVSIRDLETWVHSAAGGPDIAPNPDLDGLVARVRGDMKSWQELPRLSQREFELLALLAEGLPNAEIGTRLFLAEKTVRNSVSQLLIKLGLHNRVEAAVLMTRYSERHRRRPRP